MKQLRKLLDILDSLPGVIYVHSSSPENNSIFFQVNNQKSLFLITRCIDRRYWKYGHNWELKISVGDMYINGILPVIYILEPIKNVAHDIEVEFEDLIDNFEHYLNHKNFLEHYEITDIVNKIKKKKRKKKIEKIELLSKMSGELTTENWKNEK